MAVLPVENASLSTGARGEGKACEVHKEQVEASAVDI